MQLLLARLQQTPRKRPQRLCEGSGGGIASPSPTHPQPPTAATAALRSRGHPLAAPRHPTPPATATPPHNRRRLPRLRLRLRQPTCAITEAFPHHARQQLVAGGVGGGADQDAGLGLRESVWVCV
jgi:hypothetical protein